jgi:DNA-binding CsgD family transcriptional regulator
MDGSTWPRWLVLALLSPSVDDMTFMDRFRMGLVDNRSLSERERELEIEILKRLAEGTTTRQVVDDLGISPHVVKVHMERISPPSWAWGT